LVVASGSLLPSIEDWFGARRELKTIQPLLAELSVRHPNIGIGVRPRGPLLFRVAEQMSLISDALFLEATQAIESEQANEDSTRGTYEDVDPETVSPELQARRVAEWIHEGRGARGPVANAKFPGPTWLRQPSGYSDREWILAIADEYRKLDRTLEVAAH